MFRAAPLVMALLLLATGSCIGFIVWHIFAPPWIEIVSIDGPPLALKFEIARINTIHRIDFYSDTHAEKLWELFFHTSSPVTAITYGVVPNPEVAWDTSPKQEFPPSKPPRPLEPGERIIVHVSFGYDQGLAPSGGSKIWLLQIEPDGNAKILPMPQDSALPSKKELPEKIEGP